MAGRKKPAAPTKPRKGQGEPTEKEKRFVQLLLVDPQRNLSRAARGAGASRASAHVLANRWLKYPRVRRYMEAMLAAAKDLAEGKPTPPTDPHGPPPAEAWDCMVVTQTPLGAIIDLGRVQTLLTAMAEGRIPTKVVRGFGAREEYDLLGANVELSKLRGGGAGPGDVHEWADALKALAGVGVEALRALAIAHLQTAHLKALPPAPVNGNGDDGA